METPKATDTLFVALKSAGESRAKLALEAVQAAFLKCFPHWQGATDRREHLRALLDELVASGQLRLPADRRGGWERTPTPPLPKWVLLVRETEPEQAPFNHRSFPWVAELAFVAGLRALRNPREVLRIHAFLKAGGRQRPMVPVKERSYEIFDDEKRLDGLRSSQLFTQGRLTLATLRCCDVPASLSCVPAPRRAPEPWLIIENEATFHSFCRLNRIISRHRGVILGSGNAVLRAVDFLSGLFGAESQSEPKEFLYFGDVDEEGIQIPHQLTRRLDRHARISVRPAERYYGWLLEKRGIEAGPGVDVNAGAALGWFPAALRSQVATALKQPKPVMQEAVGWEHLAEKFEIPADVPF